MSEQHRRITLRISEGDSELLQAVARREERDPRRQAALLLRQALEQAAQDAPVSAETGAQRGDES